MNIVYMDGKKEPYTTSEIIAECAEIEIISVRKLIDKRKEELEAFGVLSFEIHKPLKGSVGGRPRKIYRLNEQQATLLVTYLHNTKPVRNFKKNLVKAFFDMRDELSEFKLQRAMEKPKRKELTQTISNWPNAPKHAHSTVTNLLLKAVTGFNAKQLRALRGDNVALNSLYSNELKEYQALEDMVMVLIELDFTYADIKAMVNKKTHQLGA